MGFNSVLYISNDALAEIDRDPSGFWKKVRALLAGGFRASNPRLNRVSMGGFVDMAQVVTVHHADNTALVAVGGNMAQVLGLFHTGVRGPGSNFHEVDGQLDLIRRWAAQNGYALVPATPATCTSCGKPLDANHSDTD